METKKRGRVRWIALGTVLGVVAVWGGFGLVGAATSAPSTVTTCTKASNSKTKVIGADTNSINKCTKKGKGFAKNWADARYGRLAQWEFCNNFNGGPGPCGSNDFSGLDFSGAWMIDDPLTGGNFSGANFTGAWIQYVNFLSDANGANFAGANFTNAILDSQTGAWAGANFSGAIFNNTVCPDTTNSNDNGGTCVGHTNP